MYFIILFIIILYIFKIIKFDYNLYEILEKNNILPDKNFLVKDNNIHRLLNKWKRYGSLGIGETYINGEWDYNGNLEEFIEKLYNISYEDKKLMYKNIRTIIIYIISLLFNKQNIKKTKKEISEHYNISNELFELMLDSNMQYSCAYWKNAKNLEDAQIDKMELICKKLKLNSDNKNKVHVLDIGCGWGNLANYMASKYKVKVTCITISEEQYNYIRNNYKDKIKNNIINPILCDYREINNYVNEKFDRIVSVGMMEHVGYKNYTKYINITTRLLKNDGLILIHTIGTNKSLTKVSDEFINKYIFPNGMLPSYTQICKSAELNRLILQDWHNFGLYYYKTLIEWKKNFLKKVINNLKLTEKDKKIWIYYLTVCSVAFKTNQIYLYQIVFSKKGYNKVYEREV